VLSWVSTPSPSTATRTNTRVTSGTRTRRTTWDRPALPTSTATAVVVEAAKAADADAIHPGYGFLAENADFAARVEATDGITWVGPSSDAMERLGEKTHARA